jgi:hypothetical protein
MGGFRFNWILYPEARQKLEESGLMKRIDKAAGNFELNHLGYISERDVFTDIKAMDGDHLFESIPKEERRRFKNSLQDAWNKRSDFYWSIKRNGEDCREKMEAEDLLLLSGFRSMDILRDEELFDYRKFGFSSIFDFTGATGAAIEMRVSGGIDRGGFKWETTRPDGRIVTTTITGDDNADFRIYQKDITAYETIDPFGNRVYYRPETDTGRMTVAAYHSTEAQVLVSVLKYIDQIGLKPETLENKALDTISWVKSLGQGGGNCAEHFGELGETPSLPFIVWAVPLPQLDEEYQTSDMRAHNICTQFKAGYSMYIGPQKDLVMAHYLESPSGVVNMKGVVSFLPEDMDNVIRGLLYQAASGLGRTSARRLIDMMEYRFSPKFDKDQAKWLK